MDDCNSCRNRHDAEVCHACDVEQNPPSHFAPEPSEANEINAMLEASFYIVSRDGLSYDLVFGGIMEAKTVRAKLRERITDSYTRRALLDLVDTALQYEGQYKVAINGTKLLAKAL